MLKELILIRLPNLTTFSHGVEIIECPQLTKVEIKYCPELKTKIGKCPNLTDIRLYTFNGVDHLLSSCFTRKWRTQLQAIEICECDTVKEILWGGIKDAGNRHIIFPELKELNFSKLPCLTTGVDESIKFPKLEKLTIGNLPRMNSLAPMDSEPTHDDHSLHFFCNQMVEFPNLRALCLKDLHDIRSNIWCRNIPISFFRNLDYLDILAINGINNLMSFSIAKNLVNLRVLSIGSCLDMVEVIQDEKQVPDVSPFPKLQLLYITRLHKLRSFCRWNHAFELSLLRTVEIDDCPLGCKLSLWDH